MASIYELAKSGQLTKEHMANQQTIRDLNTVHPRTKLTPLGIAVWYCYVKIVKLLLKNGANPDGKDPNHNDSPVRPPLWVAAARSKQRVGTMMQLLLHAGADPNIVSTVDDNSSPLLAAVKTYRSPHLLNALVDKGANPDQENNHEETPRKIAEARGDPDTIKALRKRKERSLGWLHWIGVIVSIIVGVVAWVNAFVVVAVVGAAGAATAAGPYVTQVIKRRFHMSGIFDEKVWPEKLKQPEPKEEFQKDAKDFIEENDLNKFFPSNDPFLQTVVDKATKLEANPDNTLDTKALARLALFQPVMYCDDSGSMNEGNRVEHQIDIVERIASIATRIIPDDGGVKVRFINRNTEIMIYQRTLKDLRQLMGQQAPYGPTELGTNLRSRILEPLVYQPLRTNSLRRPVLVSIITDGCPQGPREKLETLKQAILECGRLLEAAGYERTVVRFQISQIGTDEDAKAFLKSLMREDQLQDVLYCTTGSLDEKFAKFRDNETRLEQWCDQGRPSCARCTRLNIPCVGAGLQRYKFKQENVFRSSQQSQQSQSKSLTTRKKPAVDQLPKFETLVFIEEIPRVPVNGITALRNSFIETLKPTTDLRYNLAWSFGGFLVDIPRRLGVNEALDSAVQVLVDSHQDFCAGLGVTSRVLVGYSRALRMLRSYLDDPAKARTSETLCSVMVLLMCQRFIGVSEGDFTGHCEGAAQLLRARRYYDPNDEFESKLVLSLRGPVVFEGLLNQKIQFTPEEWKTLVENHLDGVTPEGRMMRGVAKVPGLLNRARKARKDGVTDENLLIDALAAYHMAKGAADELREKYKKARLPPKGEFSFQDPIVMAHSFYQRSFGLSLTVVIILSCVVTGIDPGNAVVVDPSIYIDEILEIAGSAMIYRPLAASFVPMCLMMAWISTGDLARRQTIEAALKAYENDYAEGQAVVMTPKVEQISRQLRLVDLNV